MHPLAIKGWMILSKQSVLPAIFIHSVGTVLDCKTLLLLNTASGTVSQSNVQILPNADMVYVVTTQTKLEDEND